MIHLYTYHHDGEVIHEHYKVYYHTVDYSKCCKTFLVNKNNNKKMFNNIKSRTEQGINYSIGTSGRMGSRVCWKKLNINKQQSSLTRSTQYSFTSFDKPNFVDWKPN